MTDLKASNKTLQAKVRTSFIASNKTIYDQYNKELKTNNDASATVLKKTKDSITTNFAPLKKSTNAKFEAALSVQETTILSNSDWSNNFKEYINTNIRTEYEDLLCALKAVQIRLTAYLDSIIPTVDAKVTDTNLVEASVATTCQSTFSKGIDTLINTVFGNVKTSSKNYTDTYLKKGIENFVKNSYSNLTLHAQASIDLVKYCTKMNQVTEMKALNEATTCTTNALIFCITEDYGDYFVSYKTKAEVMLKTWFEQIQFWKQTIKDLASSISGDQLTSNFLSCVTVA